ncbi:competence protein ComEA [Bacillus sp. AFS076308]|nr:competence protein ComEA [Bacillus sp. AFS076308]PGV54474.1 competence protein ComEA [Bacillus sp. AFS037270]
MDSAPLNSISQVNEALKQDVETGTEKNATPAANQPENIMVDVKGQVNRPGVYQSNTGERVIDVIGRAGGLTEQADQTQVNFAEHVEDEMVIYIPGKGEEGSSLPSSIGTSGTVSSADGQKQGKININKADEQELQNLPGIGPAKAAAIIEFRNTSGPFKAIEDLKNISGIGDKTFEKLKDLIAVK